jgi:hypothetical protein
MLPILVRLHHPGPVLCVCTGTQPLGLRTVRLVSLTENGTDNHSQAKAKGRAPVVGAGLER